VPVFVITVACASSAAASDARSEAAGDAGTSSRPSDNEMRLPRRRPKGSWAQNNGQDQTESTKETSITRSWYEPTSKRHRNREYQH
jgi:hypothetical protein